MNAKQLFDDATVKCSKLVTRKYSTSFSLGILLLNSKLRDPVYSIYGFVRFADEIVDTFHDYDKHELLADFKKETYKAIDQGISLNPILNSFQSVVRRYGITPDMIDTFLKSMEMDLNRKKYTDDKYDEYILGSAEVVGLMCLKVFVQNDDALYERLKPYAMKLGAAFQKINFLRDLHSDYGELGRVYFPGLDPDCFDDDVKACIEKEIKKDFDTGLEGIKMLPESSRFGVYIAYVYFYSLLKKIQNTPSKALLQRRIRIRNEQKTALLVKSYVRHYLNIL